MNSMTGFGRGSAENELGTMTAELKSVNSRFLEINMRSDHFPPFWKIQLPDGLNRPCIGGR